VQSPLDKLSRDKVASSERSALQTKEVVAVLGQHRGRHYGSVNSVACSPDGKTVASAGEDGVVRLWNLATLEQQEVLKGRGTGMTSVAYSPDGHLLASGDWAGVVRIWEPGRKGPGDPTQLEHDDGVTALAFSPDGRILAVALDDGTAQIWRLFPGERPRKGSLLTGHKDGLTSLAFSHDGQLLVTGSTDRTIRVWDRNTIPPRLQQVLTGHSSPVLAVAVGPDNQTVVSGSEGGRLRFWDAATGKSRDDARGTSFSASIQSIAFIPKGQQLILGLSDHRIVIVYFSKFGPKQGPTLTDVDAVSSVALAPMRRAIVTGTAAGTVRVWDWGFSGDPQERPMGRGHAGWLAGLVFTADGRSLYSAGRDRTVRLWELAAAEPQERAVFQGQGALSSLALSPDGKRLAAGGMYDSEIRLWELPATVPRTWKMSKEEQSHAAAVAFADPQTLVTAGQDTNKDGTIRIWDLAKTDPQAQTALRGHTSLVNSLALSQNGQVMASAGGSDASVRIWDLPRRRELHQFFGAKGGTVGPVALSPDGKLLAFSSSFTDEMLNRSDYSVALYDLGGAPPRPMPPLPGHAAQVLAVAFAPDGQKLATADEAGRLVLWERRTWQPLQDWRLPGPVSALVFAPDGRHLAVGNGNGTIYILRLKAATSRP
jgi:WD40 repeat protein